ncbi:MAG: TonB family protein [Terracidiphilus sp.]
MNYCKSAFGLTVVFVLFAGAALAQQATQSTTQSTQPAAQTPAPALPDAPVATAVLPNGPTVVMDTSMGRITCQFFQKQAPLAVANFIGLAEGTKEWTDPATNKVMRRKKFYDETPFHRVIPEFMIQGGDPTGTGTGGPGYAFDDEFDPNLNFDVPGRLAMANSGPNTNASQFFITELPQESLNQHYTIFGQCDDSSVAVVKTIARVERDGNDKPLSPVILEKVTIVREGQSLPPLPGAAPAAPSGNAAQPAAPRKMVNVSGGVEYGLRVSLPKPVPPPGVKWSGTVVLDAVVDETGAVEPLHIISGRADLQQAAIDTAKTWRYRPYLLNGQPIAVHTQITVNF